MDEPLDPAARRRANRWGLALGGVALGVLILAIALFTIHGLPKDPEIVREQQRAAARSSTAADLPR